MTKSVTTMKWVVALTAVLRIRVQNKANAAAKLN
jgi:hypothetical protein